MFSLSLLFLTTSGVTAMPVAVPACATPDPSFQQFLRQFEDDAGFRRSRLELPLVVRTGDGITNKAVIELWTLAKVRSRKEPLIYTRVDLKKYRPKEEILLLQTRRYAEVLQADAGEGDATRLMYRFRYRSGCWILEGFDDMGE
jgi:hypothetical protein